jgi:hypothetical protein
MFIIARIKPARKSVAGLFESGGSRIAASNPPDVTE